LRHRLTRLMSREDYRGKTLQQMSTAYHGVPALIDCD
jgi:hypothetical protein